MRRMLPYLMTCLHQETLIQSAIKCCAHVQTFADTDPTSLHFARPAAAAQRAFWHRYICGHILDSEPRLNFLARGGEAAIVANLLPQQEVSIGKY